MSEPLECEVLTVQTRARCEQVGACSLPPGFAFQLEVRRFDGHTVPLCVVDADRVAALIADFAPEVVLVACGDHEDEDELRIALGLAAPRALH